MMNTIHTVWTGHRLVTRTPSGDERTIHWKFWYNEVCSDPPFQWWQVMLITRRQAWFRWALCCKKRHSSVQSDRGQQLMFVGQVLLKSYRTLHLVHTQRESNALLFKQLRWHDESKYSLCSYRDISLTTPIFHFGDLIPHLHAAH